MASFLLPQAMLAVSGNPSVQLQFPPLKNLLVFSTHRFASRGNSLSNGSFNSVFAVPLRNSFVVRSENGSDNVSVENEGDIEVEAVVVENLESEPGSEAEPESETEREPRPPRKPRIKMGDIMGILNKKAVEASEEQRPIPDIRTGDVVEIKLEVPENRRRLSVYKGIVISRQNAGIHTTIRIRRIIAGVGVEIVFPLYSPNIKELKVVSHRKVRKARLYYLRDKLPRLSTFK